MNKKAISMRNLLLCISDAQEMMAPQIYNHHQKVAYLAFRIAEQLRLPMDVQRDIFYAALIHDIGALSMEERLEVIEKEPSNVNSHAFRGAKLLSEFEPLKKASTLIKFHHIPWNHGAGLCFLGEEVPIESHIIHLADRTCAMMQNSENIISQLSYILSTIKKGKGSVFAPDLIDSLMELENKYYIWLDLMAKSPIQMIPEIGLYDKVVLNIDGVIDLAAIFSKIIDFRSSFTALHSAGVAKTAEKLAQYFGFSVYECKMMLIAGYLHDLGKIGISSDILEKEGKLSEDEFNKMRSHTYYTYRLLEDIPEFYTINVWASYHHEKLDGNGYPFKIKGDDLPLGSRIMAVADVFNAIKEDRPYRKGMEDHKVINVLQNMVESGALDGNVVTVLIDHYQEISKIRELAQQKASEKYKAYLKMDSGMEL